MLENKGGDNAIWLGIFQPTKELYENMKPETLEECNNSESRR
jgi:hypothetical protein